MRFQANTEIPAYNLNTWINLQFDQRGYKLTYTRSFGKEKLKEKRERSTGVEDEKGRVQ